MVEKDAGFLAVFGVELYHFDFAFGHNACSARRVIDKLNGIVKIFIASVTFGWLRNELGIIRKKQAVR